MWKKGELRRKKEDLLEWKEVLRKESDEKVVKDSKRAQVDKTGRIGQLFIQISLLPGETLKMDVQPMKQHTNFSLS